jgi:hypothetical protein
MLVQIILELRDIEDWRHSPTQQMEVLVW